jgi:type II secretory pathway predicted ATPase ExeA
MERFGLHSDPFTNEIPIAKRMKIPSHETEVKALKTVVEQRRSGAVIAPAGAGKSLVLRALTSILPPARYSCHYIKVTDLSSRDLWREIAFAVGAKPVGIFPALVRSIQEHFDSSFNDNGLRQVILVDEAHDLRPKALSLLKIMTNYDMDSRLVVSVILAGQPSLKNMLYRPGMEEVRRRLAHCGELRLLSRDETKRYIEHRIHVAGGTKVPFDDSAIEAIFEMSRGNLGAIDQLAGKSLEIADKEKHQVVDSNDAVQARNGLWM